MNRARGGHPGRHAVERAGRGVRRRGVRRRGVSVKGRGLRHGADGERGQMIPMLIGFVAIVLVAVMVVANASKAFLYRRSLASWADGAAIAAAQDVAESAIYSGELGDVLPFADAEAGDEVGAYVERHELAVRFEEFTVTDVSVSADGAVAVELSARMDFVWSAGTDAGLTMTARATAVAPIQ